MIEVIIVTNNQPIRRVAVYNRGPVGGVDGESYDPGDGPGGSGLRRYEWQIIDGKGPATYGDLLHHRSDGAEQLAAAALEAVAEHIKLTRTFEQSATWQIDDPEG